MWQRQKDKKNYTELTFFVKWCGTHLSSPIFVKSTIAMEAPHPADAPALRVATDATLISSSACSGLCRIHLLHRVGLLALANPFRLMQPPSGAFGQSLSSRAAALRRGDARDAA
jgi:hypothetical protein